MILLSHEESTYADIARVNDLRKDYVKMIIGKLRRLIPQYLIQHADRFVTAMDNYIASHMHRTSPGEEKKLGSLEQFNSATNEASTDAAVDHWENEGGALAGQGRECLPGADSLWVS
ncbi:MAG: hypothetical protein ACYSWW_27615 [Planctomycetota bacterium]|jgi:hypothetical protein